MKLKDLAMGVSDLLKIDPKTLMVEPGFNIRFDRPELTEANEELKESIRASGIQRPFMVRLKDDQVYVVDGHRRLQAVMTLLEEGVEIPSVPCLPEGRGVSEADRTAFLITANSGLPLSQLEKGEVCKRLLGFGWTMDQIGAKLGLGAKQVGNLVDLAGAPQEVKELVSTGQVSATLALKEIKKAPATAAATLKTAVTDAKAQGKTKATAKDIKKKAVETVAAEKILAFGSNALGTPLGMTFPEAGATMDIDVDPFSSPSPAPRPTLAESLAEAAKQPEQDKSELVPDEDGVMPKPKVRHTAVKFAEIVDSLYQILNVDTLATAQIIARDALGVSGIKGY